MNENYLRYLMNDLRSHTGISVGDIWGSIGDYVYEEPDISFLKKEGIKPFKFIEEKPILTLDLGNLNDVDMEYFTQRLLASLRTSIPNQYFNNNPQQSVSGYDEFH
jgi:hypothetical protein